MKNVIEIAGLSAKKFRKMTLILPKNPFDTLITSYEICQVLPPPPAGENLFPGKIQRS